MTTDQKIIVGIVVAVLVAIMATIGCNAYNTTARVAAYRECLAANKQIVETIVAENPEAARFLSIPACYMR